MGRAADVFLALHGISDYFEKPALTKPSGYKSSQRPHDLGVQLLSYIFSPLEPQVYYAHAQDMLLSYTFSYILALLISATYLPTIRAVPFPKNILIPALAASNDLQQVRHHAPTADIPGRLTSRAGGPGNQVGHPASLMHMMTTVPGSFRNLVTIVPVEEAAAAL